MIQTLPARRGDSKSINALANSLWRQVLLGAVCSLGSEAVSWFLLWWQQR